jgi:hypothetical protein
MSCPKDSSATISSNVSSGFAGGNSVASNNYTQTSITSPQYNNNVTQNNSSYLQSKCRKIVSKYPYFSPIIFRLSVTKSASGSYSVVYVFGANFLPPVIGTTYVNFGPYTNLPIIFFNNFSLSFVVPLSAKVGEYLVKVVNIYNGNFSPQVNNTYSGNLNYSNGVTYTIT